MQHPFQHFASYGIKQFYRDFTSLYEQKLAVHGLTAAQVNVLEQLWTLGDGMTQKELHEKLHIRPASLSNLVDALAAGNWVKRKADLQDARVKRIFLTDAGRAQSKICMAIITELEQIIRQGMASEEVALMLFWLRKMQQNLPKEKDVD